MSEPKKMLVEAEVVSVKLGRLEIEGGRYGWETVVKMDGRPVPGLTRVTVEVGWSQATRVTLELLAFPPELGQAAPPGPGPSTHTLELPG